MPALGPPQSSAAAGNVIAISPPPGKGPTGAKNGALASATRSARAPSAYLTRVMQSLVVTETERKALETILRHDWATKLDGNFSHLSDIDGFADILRGAAKAALDQLGDLEHAEPDLAHLSSPAEVEEVRDAFLALQGLTSLREHLHSRARTAAEDQLLIAIDGLIVARPNALHTFENAVGLVDLSVPPHTARAADLS